MKKNLKLKPSEELFQELDILIVDDNTMNIQVLGNTLKKHGFQFEFALDGKAALSWMEKKAFHLVLLDVMMPEMDGFETLQKIRERPEWEDIAVIFLTARSDMNSLVRGFELGLQDYLTKPFNPQELISRVKAHLARTAHQRLLKSFNDQLETTVNERTKALLASEKALIDVNESLNNLISNIPNVVFRCEIKEGVKVIFLSPQFEDLSGYKVDKFISDGDKALRKLIPREERTRMVEIFSSGEPHFSTKMKLITADGDMLWVVLEGNRRHSSKDSQVTVIEGVMYDITQQVALEELLMTSSTQAADRERDIIARELHDGIQQNIASVTLVLQSIKESGLEEVYRDRFKESVRHLKSVTKEIRDISHRLVPKDVQDLGLATSVRDLINRQKGYAASEISFDENVQDKRYAGEIEINIYRIIQEALNNIEKYANASTVAIQLFERSGILTLMIEDDGEGFDDRDINYRKKGFGLLSMESRATSIGGYFEINSNTGGTQVMVEVPLKKDRLN